CRHYTQAQRYAREKSQPLHDKKAYAAMEDRDWEEALAGFRMVLSSNPKHVQSYRNMGLCLAFLERKKSVQQNHKLME
ncbi:MAG: hypothetical protein ACE5I1_26530, partial [bacterium]